MRHVFKSTGARVAMAALMFGLAHPALADTTIRAFLWNADEVTEMATDLGIGMAGPQGTAVFGVALSTATVPAGKITFDVLNASQTMVHEMVVSPLAADGALPINAETQRVDEDLSAAVGEVSEIEPGARGSVTLDLAPGRYALYCNLPGHYLAGMWVILTVS